MQPFAKQMLVACGVFFVATFLLGGLVFDQGFGRGALVSSVFATVMFALVYGAIRVGAIIFFRRE